MIGGDAPSRYLPRLRRDVKEEKLNRILVAHWIEPCLLERDRFSSCFVKRGQAMFDLINQAMGRPTVDGGQVFQSALESAAE